jgi:hypothetical protein
MQLAKYFSNLPERFGVRVTEAKILRDLIITICLTNLISQQANASGFTIKDHYLFKVYILIPRIQNLVISGGEIVKSTNNMIDEIWTIVINIIKFAIKVGSRFTILIIEI